MNRPYSALTSDFEGVDQLPRQIWRRDFGRRASLCTGWTHSRQVRNRQHSDQRLAALRLIQKREGAQAIGRRTRRNGLLQSSYSNWRPSRGPLCPQVPPSARSLTVPPHRRRHPSRRSSAPTGDPETTATSRRCWPRRFRSRSRELNTQSAFVSALLGGHRRTRGPGRSRAPALSLSRHHLSRWQCSPMARSHCPTHRSRALARGGPKGW
jgi:hypothetical protein